MIAISYRREDSQAAVGRIHEYLENAFGKDHVFIDFDSIPLGVDFRDHIRKVWTKCDTILVVIGKHWAGIRSDNTRRLDDPTDLLRIEVETALSSGIRVIPILLDGTPLPSLSDLPPSLRDLTFRNGMNLETGANFKPHIDRLIKTLQNSAQSDAPDRRAQTSPSPEPVPKRTPSVGNTSVTDFRTQGKDVHGPHAHPAPANMQETRLSILEVQSDPPGAHVVLDGGQWEVTTPCTIIKVPWGAHHYRATFEEETRSSAFGIVSHEHVVSIAFEKVLLRRANEQSEQERWARATAADTEDAYEAYLAESPAKTQQDEAEKRLEKLRAARARREQAERKRLEAEAAAERARREEGEREQTLWAEATQKDTKQDYAAYLAETRLNSHRGEAEARVAELAAALARQKEERKELKLWTDATSADTEAAYETYLTDSLLLVHRAGAMQRLADLRTERARAEEEDRQRREREAAADRARQEEELRQRRERETAEQRAREEEERRDQVLWAAAAAANTIESYGAYLAESRLLVRGAEAQQRAEALRQARAHQEAEERRRRKASEAAEQQRLDAVRNDKALWVAATRADTEEGYTVYLRESELAAHKPQAESRLAELQAARMRREEKEAAARRAEAAEAARLVKEREKREADEAALKRIERKRKRVEAKVRREKEVAEFVRCERARNRATRPMRVVYYVAAASLAVLDQFLGPYQPGLLRYGLPTVALLGLLTAANDIRIFETMPLFMNSNLEVAWLGGIPALIGVGLARLGWWVHWLWIPWILVAALSWHNLVRYVADVAEHFFLRNCLMSVVRMPGRGLFYAYYLLAAAVAVADQFMGPYHPLLCSYGVASVGLLGLAAAWRDNRLMHRLRKNWYYISAIPLSIVCTALSSIGLACWALGWWVHWIWVLWMLCTASAWYFTCRLLDKSCRR